MATRNPQAARCVASQATSGVLPVPPTVRLPITATGALMRTRCRRPRRYRKSGKDMTEPCRKENGASHRGRAPLYHMASSLVARDGMASGAELRALQAGIGALAGHQFRVGAAFDD